MQGFKEIRAGLMRLTSQLNHAEEDFSRRKGKRLWNRLQGMVIDTATMLEAIKQARDAVDVGEA